MKTRPTRADVASRAGVSKTTVTYVLSNRSDVAIPEQTRARVREAAKHLGYRPHAAAKALASGRTNSITVAYPERIGSHCARVLQAFERHTNAHGYHMIASTVGHLHIDNVLPDLWSLLSNLTDGIILVDMPAHFRPYIDEMLPNVKPIVSMGVFTVPSIDCVEVDIGDAVNVAMAHLLSANPRRIAYVGPQMPELDKSRSNTPFAGDPRPAAYYAAVAQSRRSAEVIEGYPGDRQASGEALRTYITERGCPDALFCFNDDIAISAYRVLREFGLRIPQDVIITGCDGNEESLYLDPPLSTIVQPLDRMCETAWQFMINRLDHPDLPRQHTVVESQFDIRGSSSR